jgi:sugar O-acyltransferase (sialic acid O-acetyltransferase NeuD family)
MKIYEMLAIYGAGGLGRELFDISIRINAKTHRWKQIIFIDDFNKEGEFFGTKRIAFEALLKIKDQCECIVGVGEPAAREKLYHKLISNDLKLATLIDPTALISPFVKIGEGTIICEYTTVHTGVVLGNNILIQPFSNIGHDIKIGNHSVMSPYCAPGGSSTFGDRVFIGMQSTLKEKLVIGDDAIIGMGAVVYQDVPANATVIGNPARITRGNDDRKVFK